MRPYLGPGPTGFLTPWAVRDGRISKDTKNAASILVVSRAPGFLGNSPGNEAGAGTGRNVALVGQVPVKVRGAVRQGNYILPSGHHDGVGVARSKGEVSFEEFKDRVVGVAWEDSLVEGIKVVNVAVGIK